MNMIGAGSTWGLGGDGLGAGRQRRRLVDHRGAGAGRAGLTLDKRTVLPQEPWLCCQNLSFLWQL